MNKKILIFSLLIALVIPILAQNSSNKPFNYESAMAQGDDAFTKGDYTEALELYQMAKAYAKTGTDKDLNRKKEKEADKKIEEVYFRIKQLNDDLQKAKKQAEIENFVALYAITKEAFNEAPSTVPIDKILPSLQEDDILKTLCSRGKLDIDIKSISGRTVEEKEFILDVWTVNNAIQKLEISVNLALYYYNKGITTFSDYDYYDYYYDYYYYDYDYYFDDTANDYETDITKIGYFKLALAEFEKLQKEELKNPETKRNKQAILMNYAYMALCCEKIKNNDKAIEYYEKYLDLTKNPSWIYPKLQKLYRDRITVYYKDGDTIKAQAIIKKWSTLPRYGGNIISQYENIIELCEEFDDIPIAKKYAEEWIDNEPENYKPYQRLAYYYYEDGEIIEAHEIIAKWSKLLPEESYYDEDATYQYEKIIELCGEYKDISTAKKYAEEWIENEPENYKPYQWLAKHYYQTEEKVKAQEIIKKWSTLPPEKKRYGGNIISQYENIIELYIKFKDIPTAKKYAEEWIEKEPENSKPYQLLATIYYQNDEIIEAQKIIAKWSKLPPEEVGYYYKYTISQYKKIIELCEEYDISTAKKYAEEWIENEPKSFDAYQLLATIYYKDNDVENARRMIERWFETEKSYEDITHLCAIQKDYSEGMKYVEKWIEAESDPEESNAYFYASYLSYFNDDEQNAIDYAQKYIELDLKNAFTSLAYEIITRSYYTLKNYQKTIEAAQKWINLDSYEDEETPIYFLAVAYYQLDSINKALENTQQYIKLKPDNYWGYSYAAFIYLEQKDTLNALQNVKKWEELTSDNHSNYSRIANIYLRLNDNVHAKINFYKAYELAITEHVLTELEQKDADTTLLVSLSWYCLFINKYEESVKFSKKALNRSPTTNYAETNLALGYLLNDQWDEAEKIYSKKNEKYTIDNEEKLWRDILLEEICTMKKYGVQHPDFEKALELLDASSDDCDTEKTD